MTRPVSGSIFSAGDFLHHFGRDLVGAFRPDVHHEIVLLLVGGQTVLILLLIFAHAMARFVDQLLLGGGHDHVVLAERDAGLAGFAEAQRHHRVGEQHGLLLAAMTIDLVDQLADFLLAQQAVDQLERDLGIDAAGFPRSSCGRAWNSTRRVIGLPSASTVL